MDLNDLSRAWLARQLDTDPRALSLVPVSGATSSSVFRVSSPRGPFFLRVLDNARWLALEPDLIEHEVAALAEAQRAHLPAPAPLAHSLTDVGFGAPVILTTFLPGQMELPLDEPLRPLPALAAALARIHAHRAPAFPWRYKSWVAHDALAVPAWARVPDLWARAIAIARRPAPPYDAVFIHRDYHSLNVLWEGEQLTGIVDWINACQGPAGVDVAHCRTDLAVMFGGEVADRFLELYARAAPAFRYDPYWDVDSVLDMCFPRPPWYSPWTELGLPPPSPSELESRLEAYLMSVVTRFCQSLDNGGSPNMTKKTTQPPEESLKRRP